MAASAMNQMTETGGTSCAEPLENSEPHPYLASIRMPEGFGHKILLKFWEKMMSFTFGRNVLLNSVGFDRLLDAFEQMNAGDGVNKAQGYPPYNIVKINERDYAIEIAVAGFRRDEIDITSEGNKLTVTGKFKSEPMGEYLHKGIANRDFRHEFTLAETVIVASADIENGLLLIKLQNVIPAEKLPRKIQIGAGSGLIVEEEAREKIAA